ncbi:MAG: DMT family transporter [Alphaproteobacteria bacterium]|nr:DMT family transporter [Alphaproteobacteria bacterium]
MSETARTADARWAVVAAPAAFVVLWSSGFIGAKAGLQHAEPMPFLALRFAVSTALMAAIAWAMAAPWPRRPAEIGHIAVAGLLMQFVYFTGCWYSMSAGVGAGTSAVICALQPVVTAVLAGPVLGERVARRQWLGLVLGIAGVAMVVSNKLEAGLGTPIGMAMSGVALLGITLGLLYQKRFCPAMDPRSGNVIQFIASGIVAALLGLALGESRIEWTGEFLGALGYTSVFTSLVSLTLLAVMIRRGEATRVTTMFFLMPLSASVISYFYFGETITGFALVGMVVVVVGVVLAVGPTRWSNPA